ncbi:MAG: anaerobic ribonucleoside-triphosphate reductase activating protein [Candidatus Hadarchaeales archaeon]
MKFRLAGISQLSTIDWPGNISAVIFFQGCNLRCPWCQNVDTVDCRRGETVDVRKVIQQVKKSEPIVTAVVLSGGEPLLQPKAALNLLKDAGKLGLKRAIETNATRPEALELLLPHLDFVAVDVKAPLSNPELYKRATGVKEEIVEKVGASIELVMDAKVPLEARTTIVPTLTDDEGVIWAISREIKKIPSFRLQQFRNLVTLNPEFQRFPPPSRERLLSLAGVAKRAGVKEVKIFTTEKGLERV